MKRLADADISEIEITPEMIEAGARVLRGEIDCVEFLMVSAHDLAVEVYLAMAKTLRAYPARKRTHLRRRS